MKNNLFEENIQYVKEEIGCKVSIIVKEFFIGKEEPLDAALIYINALSNKDFMNRDILSPLMTGVNERIALSDDTAMYLCKKYITMSSTLVEKDLSKAVEALKSGKSIIFVDGIDNFIIIDTTGGVHRPISDPANESSIRGAREGFVENIETNVSVMRRRIKDKELSMEYFKVGKRSQTELALVYIKDIVDNHLVDEVRKRISAIDVDFVTDTGMVEQYIEDNPYSVFPQSFATERPDIVEANILEGRVAIILNGTPYVLTAPAIFVEFFQGVEDYYERTVAASFVRILRAIAIFMSITFPAIYLTLIRFNAELIPIKFILPIVESRQGIALTPFLEILSMEIIVEFLREGGVRLPPRVATTLSIVGGIIIGDTAVKSKVVSPSTLLIVGITIVSTFLIPNYEMSLAIRFLRFPMLVLANVLGLFGIAAGWYFIIVHLSSLKSFGVPYFSLKKDDLKDIFIRAPLWQMNNRPKEIPNNNNKRQSNFRLSFWRKNNNE